MKYLLSTFFLFFMACATPQSDAQAQAQAQAQDSAAAPAPESQVVAASYRSRLQFGATTAVADFFVPFEYEQSFAGFRVAHPFMSLTWNREQGILLKGDIPTDDSGEFQKFALLVRPEHIEGLQNEEVQVFIEGLRIEMEDRVAGGEEPQKVGMEMMMRLAEGILEENYSISSCLYQIATAGSSNACPTNACCDSSGSYELQKHSIWNSENMGGFRFIATASFPKHPDVEGGFEFGGGWKTKPADSSLENWTVNEGKDTWDYELDYTQFMLSYLSQLLPASIDWRVHSMNDGWFFPAEAWLAMTLPTRAQLEVNTRSAINEGISMGEMLLSFARDSGHLIPKTETAIVESSYKDKINGAFTDGLDVLDKALSENPVIEMFLGEEMRFGMTASRPEKTTFEPGYFSFEVPTDRTVIEVVPMLDMFGRMGLSQLMMQMNQGAMPEQEEAF
ncbi:MAG: hypothetical protein QGH51_04680 [Planctomycetota bacterium]|nr:hypothetical protein [Planctomycetota bacterium]MDP6941307.1 hypothetical protein [Planctomycetota bacterium]